MLRHGCVELFRPSTSMLLPHQRPVHFSPLNEVDYATFYDLEMGNYNEDLPFYASFIQPHQHVLELGCGQRQTQQAFDTLSADPLPVSTFPPP